MMTICKNGMEIGAFDAPRRKVPVLGFRDGKSGVVSVVGYFRSEELADEFVAALAAMCGAEAVPNGRSADWIYQYKDCGRNGWIIDEASTKAIRQHGEALNPSTMTLSQAISVYSNAAACDTALAGKQKERIAKWLVELRDRRLNDVAPGVAPSGTCCQSAARTAKNAAGWIPCSEKQPENAGPALVYLGGGCIEVDCWNGKKWIDCGGEIMHPVFWMPLPEPPKDILADAAATPGNCRGGCCQPAAETAGNAADDTDAEWIPCSEQMPEKDCAVIVAVYGSDMIVPEPGETPEEAAERIRKEHRYTTEAFLGSDGWYTPDYCPLMVAPTYWMPMPEAPELGAPEKARAKRQRENAAADQAERSGADSIADAANICQQVHAELWRLFDRLRGTLADEAVLRADRLHAIQIAADQMLHTADTVRTAQKSLILSAAKDQGSEPEMQKVRHAAWIHEPEYHETVCSLCGAVSPNGWYWRYCHHCGARMDRKEGAGNDKP